MDGKTRLGLGVLGTALVLGLLGGWLLRATPWGVNLFLWVAALVGAAALVVWRGCLRVAGEGRWLVPVALLFAACVAWRASAALAFLNVLAFLATASLALLRARTGRLRLAGLSEYLLGGIYAAVLSSAGPLPVAAREVEWRQVAQGRWRAPALAATRGVFLAAPLLILFGALFAAADAVFQSLLSDLFGFDVAEALGHHSLTVALAWFSAGALWVSLLAQGRADLTVRRPEFLSLGIVEVGTVLGLLDLLFLAFVAVQVRYLFGGAERIVSTAGLTYAEYARRGFFELVTVTAIALPTLLLAHWLLRADDRRGERTFGILAGTLVALHFVVMASALQRMYLYVDEYALTQLRFYVTAFVARTNLDRMHDGERFDAYYVTSLSADAVPVIVEALPSMREADRRTVEASMEPPSRWYRDDANWRSWNLGRSRARHAVEGYVTPEPPQAGREPRSEG
jgi:hypothetical protein